MRMKTLKLTTRCKNALLNGFNGYHAKHFYEDKRHVGYEDFDQIRVEEFIKKYSEQDLLRFPNFGRKYLSEVTLKMGEYRFYMKKTA